VPQDWQARRDFFTTPVLGDPRASAEDPYDPDEHGGGGVLSGDDLPVIVKTGEDNQEEEVDAEPEDEFPVGPYADGAPETDDGEPQDGDTEPDGDEDGDDGAPMDEDTVAAIHDAAGVEYDGAGDGEQGEDQTSDALGEYDHMNIFETAQYQALSTRAKNLIKNNEIETVGQFKALSEDDIRSWKNCGETTVTEIFEAVGLEFTKAGEDGDTNVAKKGSKKKKKKTGGRKVADTGKLIIVSADTCAIVDKEEDLGDALDDFESTESGVQIYRLGQEVRVVTTIEEV
jgi:hypothetical protein